MLHKLALIGVIVAAGVVFMPQMGSAAGVTSPGSQITHASLVEPTGIAVAGIATVGSAGAAVGASGAAWLGMAAKVCAKGLRLALTAAQAL